MLREEDLPSAKEIHRMTIESNSAYESTVNNMIIDIKNATKTGICECHYPYKVPKAFSDRLKKWLNGLGYEVQFSKAEGYGDTLGSDIQMMKVFIRWYHAKPKQIEYI